MGHFCEIQEVKFCHIVLFLRLSPLSKNQLPDIPGSDTTLASFVVVSISEVHTLEQCQLLSVRSN